MNIKLRQIEWINKKNQKQTNLWILCNGQTYKLKPFVKNIIVYKHWNPGTLWNIVPPARPLLLWATKRGGPRHGGEKVVIGRCGDSLLRVMGREAVTRMSSSHQMDLIN